MSRIGKKPVDLPSGVTATVSGQTVSVKGPKGTREFTATDDVTIALEDNAVTVKPRGLSKRARQQWGMSRTQIVNLVEGVTKGYSHTLEIQGVGYRAAMQGKDTLQVQAGFSHDVIHKIPAGVEVKIGGAKQELITVSGIDKQKVGQIAAEIRAARPPEPYQGKGIRYQGEQILRKEGKKK